MKVRNLKVPLPSGKYFSKFEVNDDGLTIEVRQKKKIALLLIGLNHLYWPYLKQVIEDAKKNFLPHHHVDFYVWTDIPENDSPEFLEKIKALPSEEDLKTAREFARTVDELNQINKNFSRETIQSCVDFVRSRNDIIMSYADPIEWPMGTLMRYHLFLRKEKELKDYDYLFYLDADMRIVEKISDEILGEALTAAEHPMYSLKPQLIPPYEPNKESTAYIPRTGIVENKRFRPLYVAGGFQGGTSRSFLKAMRVMKKNIDKDFNKDYIAVWNDESHWNKYVFKYANPADGHKTIVLGPEYIHPDSLIKEYYEPIWGRTLTPKIVTLTKPWQLTKEAGDALRRSIGDNSVPPVQYLPNKFQCPTCKDVFQQPNMHIEGVHSCGGKGQPHQLQMKPL